MTFLNVKNRAESTLASDITDVATELTVATGEGVNFPTTNFHITIEDEILLCSSRSTDVFTVEREAEGTTGVAHDADAAVELRITAEVITELQTYVGFEVSDNLQASNDAVASWSSGDWGRMKQIDVCCKGVIRVKFDLRNSAAGKTAYGKVYINDIDVGTLRTVVGNVYETFSEDFAVTFSDKIQIWGSKIDNNVEVRNFRLYWDLAGVDPYTVTYSR